MFLFWVWKYAWRCNSKCVNEEIKSLEKTSLCHPELSWVFQEVLFRKYKCALVAPTDSSWSNIPRLWHFRALPSKLITMKAAVSLTCIVLALMLSIPGGEYWLVISSVYRCTIVCGYIMQCYLLDKDEWLIPILKDTPPILMTGSLLVTSLLSMGKNHKKIM